MSIISEEFERSAREKTQPSLESVVPRDLLPNGAYAPIPGIYDVGWKGWMNLPYADFAKEARNLDDGLIRDDKEFSLRLAPMVSRGELSTEQLKIWEAQNFLTVDDFAINIVRNVFNNLQNREVRDIILRHASEEIGHAELKADFLVGAFRMDRVKDVWGQSDLISKSATESSDLDTETPQLTALRKESSIAAYAIIPFLERNLPTLNKLMGEGLRKHYGFKSNLLGFYDLHTYVDIYHERLGLYLLAKYASTRKIQELFLDAVQSIRKSNIEFNRSGYEALSKVK
jgi:pyrroloquinoline quinone (PQQ) biosynthesis protein C